MPVGDGVEREVKLSVDADFSLPPSLAEGGGPLVVEALEPRYLDAVYHDADDLRLLALGITVRRRTGEGTRWTVKFPTAELAAAGGSARREIDVKTDARIPPEAVVELVASVLGGASLVPVARLVSQRERWALLDGDGQSVAELDDDRVTVYHPVDGSDPPASPLGFREIEVEFGADADADLIEWVVAQLIGAGASRGIVGSKVEQALTLLGRVLGRAGSTSG